MHLFLDANVLFAAALNPGGQCRALLRLAEQGLCQTASSAYVLEEARRNLTDKYPDRLAELNSLLQYVEQVAEADFDLVRWAENYLPAKDAPVLAAAVARRVDLLVTGDRRHFGALYDHELRGVRVVSLFGALQAVLARPGIEEIDVDTNSSHDRTR